MPDFASMGPGPQLQKQKIPIEMKFGDAQVASPCYCCGGIATSGLFMCMQTSTALVCCVKCMATAIVKYQDQHPGEKLFDVDVDVGDEAYGEAAKAVRGALPRLSETEAMTVAKAALKAI